MKENRIGIQLGARVKDTITGYAGIAVARSEWLTGCVRVGVDKDKMDKDGNIFETLWIDDARLVILKEPTGKLLTKEKPLEGGRSNPKQSNGG